MRCSDIYYYYAQPPLSFSQTLRPVYYAQPPLSSYSLSNSYPPHRSSENTKILSFYRKLNRWGFSMSRKNANCPHNIWSHPNFNRSSAVIALNQASKTGLEIDFLGKPLTSRGKKRTSDKEGEYDETASFMDSSVGDASIPDLCSPFLLSGSRAYSMPTLPRVSSKQRKLLAHSSLRSSNHQQQRNLLTNNFTASNIIRHTQSTSFLHQGSANRGSAANDTFDLLPPCGGTSNATFETTGEETAKATFDLTSLFSSRMTPSHGVSSPLNSLLPATAPDLFASGASNTSTYASSVSSTSNDLGRNTPIGNTNEIGSGLGFSTTSSLRRQHVHQEMTQEEDNELTAFLGMCAKAMSGPLREVEEEGASEPDPFPPNFKHAV